VSVQRGSATDLGDGRRNCERSTNLFQPNILLSQDIVISFAPLSPWIGLQDVSKDIEFQYLQSGS
jgi:hypothetical protein